MCTLACNIFLSRTLLLSVFLSYRLQQQINELEKRCSAIEKYSTPRLSVDCQCTSSEKVTDSSSVLGSSISQSCSSSNSHSIPESPVSQRCDSAPPSFATSSLKCSTVDCTPVDGVRCLNHEPQTAVGRDVCHSCQQMQQLERTACSGPIPRRQSDTAQSNSGGGKLPFLRGPSYASTRSLMAGRGTPLSSFLRKKYNTMSLRSIRRQSLSRQVNFLVAIEHDVTIVMYHAFSAGLR